MAEALKVFVVGFGGVFGTLLILCAAVYIFGIITHSFAKEKKKS
jgi:Na+-transporting methylmalonyl-CoA/oxaloacetate decarboxylase gamma subunit